MKSNLILFTITFSLLFYGVFGLVTNNSDLIQQDKQALLEFYTNLSHSHAHIITWNESTHVCTNWTGITCDHDHTHVISLQLPGVGLTGEIALNTISKLSALQVLNLQKNRLYGTLTNDLSKLKNLTSLLLQFNQFHGHLNVNFSQLKRLQVLDLSNNRLNGSIPKSISGLVELKSLNLASNSFSGVIPDLGLSHLVELNLSYNNLTGILPDSLQRFPRSAFVGNQVRSLNFTLSQSELSPLPQAGVKKGKKNSWFLVIVITSSCLGFTVLVFLCIACCCCTRNGGDGDDADGDHVFSRNYPKGGNSAEKGVSSDQDSKNGLVFFEGCNYAFDLEDLLRASAEVLGKGTFGMSYKAILEDANVVVVKRLKEVNAGKKEFEQVMDLIGGCKHENVVALRAYYYSKDEKLMVNDYCCHGSVSSMLHTQRGEGRIPLNWESRLKIAIGAARGLAHLHSLNNSKFVHGNIRSSNIFLNSFKYGCVSDFGLAAIMTSLSPTVSRAAGYRAPEVTDTRKATQSSDVYSFGVFLLELLTGKSPVHATGGDELVHLVRWVHSVVREEWTAEVFDLELLRYPHVEEEMVEMLQIALSCVARVPDQRPRMGHLLKVIEDVRRSLANLHSTM